MVDLTKYFFEKSILSYNHQGLFISMVINFLFALIPLGLLLRLHNSKVEQGEINQITNSVIGMMLALSIRFIITGLDMLILFLSDGELNLLAAWEYLPWLIAFHYSIQQIQGLIRVPKQREWRIDRIVKLIYLTMAMIIIVAVINILRLSNLVLFTSALATILIIIPVIQILRRERDDNLSLLMKARLDLTVRAWILILFHLLLTLTILTLFLIFPTHLSHYPFYIVIYSFFPGILLILSIFLFYWSLILPNFMRRKYGLIHPEFV